MKKILITGAGGQVGRSLRNTLNIDKYHGYFLTRQEFDLCDPEMMKKALQTIEPDFIINAAAYTLVDLAEENKDIADLVNAEACKTLANHCAEKSIPLFHYSSDYVYHNGLDRPLEESDNTNPQSVYASTKLNGERAIADIADKYFILRTSWVYDAPGKNFVNTMLALAKKFEKLTVVDDQIGSPTYAPDIADITMQFVELYFDEERDDKKFGVYNFSNEGVCSWYDFAKAIFELSNIEIHVDPVPSSSYPTAAARPHYSVLNKAKVRDAFPEHRMYHWRESLRRCLKEIKN